MKFFRKLQRPVAWMVAGTLLAGALPAYAKNYLYSADGRAIPIKGAPMQPDLSMYRSPLQSKVVDRRFYTNEATFMANEAYKMGMEGWNDFVKAAMPVSYRRAYQWVVAREAYMYARNLLDYVGGRTHSGVHMVQGPYWTMKALRHSDYNRLQRDRGERTFSNKDVMLGFYLPMVYQRTGFPRVFDDVQLTYLQYKSVDPRFTGKLDNTDSYEDPMTGKKGGWGVENTYFNDYPQRFDHDKMDTTFDMGALGQFLKRRSQWIDRFFQSDRYGEVGTTRATVPLLGNDAEEGMRGWGLTMGALNVMLEAKAAMFTDGEKLVGINPDTYDPANGLRYLPHQIAPDIVWLGDMPERLSAMNLKDNSSQLWDQASWLWGTSAYAVAVDRRDNFFTTNPPVDGGLVERDTGAMAESLGNAVLKNVIAMHTRNNVLVSEWTPDNGVGTTTTMKDFAMAITALHDLEQSWKRIKRHDAEAQQARELLRANADFLLSVQAADGSFYQGYDVVSGKSIGDNRHSVSQWEGVRALLSAYFTSEDTRYLQAARKAYNHVNTHYWNAEHGVYRTHLDSNLVEVTPYAIGITMAAMREMMFATPVHLVGPQIERFTRWWVQTVDQSGSMQAETKLTGEIFTGFGSGDDDGDGIPYVSKGYGKNGTGPLIAGRVVINIGDDETFNQLKGDRHNPNRYNQVRMAYQPKDEADTTQLALDYSEGADWVARKPMERADGTTIPLQAAQPLKVGLGTQHNLSGRQIFEANCAICHGQHGEGYDGKPLGDMMTYPHEVMFAVAHNGRFEKSMPPWGIGNDDGYGGTLTKAEIDKIVEYVQSESFKADYRKSQSGEVIPGSLPKDVWFYLSRENVKNRGLKPTGKEEAQWVISQQKDPATVEAAWWENIRMAPPGK